VQRLGHLQGDLEVGGGDVPCVHAAGDLARRLCVAELGVELADPGDLAPRARHQLVLLALHHIGAHSRRDP
jgi:hypothetical protein